MKKMLCFILAAALLALLPGCSEPGTAGRTAAPTGGVEDVLASGMAAAEGDGKEEKPEGSAAPEAPEYLEEEIPEPEIQESDEETELPVSETAESGENSSEMKKSIDVDLTAMSSTMVYSEVFSMLDTPDDYIGKIVKMNGIFAYYYDEASGNYYYACIIRDATACCSQGIEFVLTDEYVYPDDYPEVGEDVTVIGRFDTYTEGDYLYCTLRDAVLV
ncbi:MAG: hypothetical protein K6C09_06415 [Oscillospiraceae bacterium]|nr:hypothetical protein [Oscillospiraceae bacterium]